MKRLRIFIHADDPMVADCDSMCIFAEIVNNRLCAIESFFAVRNPVLFITGIQQFLKGIVVAEFHPHLLWKSLTHGKASVTAGIVMDLQMTTIFTYTYISTTSFVLSPR